MDKNQLKYYTNLLKDDEILLLKSDDDFFQNHYTSSPLTKITGFKGTAGEAVVEKSGKVTLFVDTRYHLLAPKQIYPNIELYKMDLGENIFEALEKKYKKNTILFVPSSIQLKNYLKLDRHFDLRKYDLEEKYNKNKDFNKKENVFLISNEIEKNDFNFKFKKLKNAYPTVDKMVIFDLDEISYLTNLRSFQAKYSSNFRSILFLDFKTNNNILFLDKIPKSKEINIENLAFKKLDEFESFIKLQDSYIFLNPEKISLKNFLAIKKPKEIKDKTISLFASIKTKSIINHLEEASLKTDLAIYNFKKQIKAGLSECDLVKIFQEELAKTGAKAESFKTLLALDENSASIHYSEYSKDKVVSGENIILLDCGGYFEGGYATDITRTFYFGYYPKQIHKTIYTNVLRAFIACFNSTSTSARKIDMLARNLLNPFNNDGFYFSHGLGHGIGTSVHQAPPTLNMFSTDTINPYQTHSIEPGLYGKDKNNVEFGVRIENCVYKDLNNKRHSLTNFPFEEILIDYSQLNTNEVDFIKTWQKNWENILKNKLNIEE